MTRRFVDLYPSTGESLNLGPVRRQSHPVILAMVIC